MPGDESQQPPAETDERFPSGPWVGFWLQRGIPGRQWMRSLRLRFCEGKVQGQGADCVGEFVFAGRYDLETGKVHLHKTYLRMHTVDYQGQNENDGKWIWGVWTLNHERDHGGFHMWPQGESDPTNETLAAEAEVPVEDLVGVAE